MIDVNHVSTMHQPYINHLSTTYQYIYYIYIYQPYSPYITMVIYHVESYSGILPRQARFQEEQIIRKKYHNQIQVANGEWLRKHRCGKPMVFIGKCSTHGGFSWVLLTWM